MNTHTQQIQPTTFRRLYHAYERPCKVSTKFFNIWDENIKYLGPLNVQKIVVKN